MNEATEDVKELASNEFGSSTSVTVGVILITLLVYFVYILRWKPPVKEGCNHRALLLRTSKILKSRSQESEKYTACDSPECVRCQKYEIVRAEAQEKLKQFIELSSESGLDRVTASLDDLKSLPASQLQRPNVLYVPGLRSQPFWSSSDEFLHVTNLFERQWAFIAQEFESVYGHTNAGWNRNSSKTGAWSVFYFYNQGVRMNENCRRCPRTAALVDSLSSFMKLNVFGNALYSVLESGTTISEHCGPCNVRIRCHLGTIILSVYFMMSQMPVERKVPCG